MLCYVIHKEYPRQKSHALQCLHFENISTGPFIRTFSTMLVCSSSHTIHCHCYCRSMLYPPSTQSSHGIHHSLFIRTLSLSFSNKIAVVLFLLFLEKCREWNSMELLAYRYIIQHHRPKRSFSLSTEKTAQRKQQTSCETDYLSPLTLCN
jgi:hypothetical protein